MNDVAKTAIFVGLAVVLCAAAYLFHPAPPQATYFDDQGEPLYPEFTDPLEAASLEVIEFDENSGSAKPFKVEVKDGVWSIPSHHYYAADGEDRLAKTAAGVIGLKKDVVQSDRVQDHEALGVIDPLDDTTPALKGRGQRVTLRDASGSVLADVIVGMSVEGKDGFRYVRLPGKKRAYAVKMDIDLSTRFADWIDTNLLGLTSSDIAEIEINDYSVDEAAGTVDQVDKIALAKDTGNKWTLEGMEPGKELDESRANDAASALSGITLTGVRPKPESLSRDLRTQTGLRLDPFSQMALQSKGFFVSGDGQLLSNEGEVRLGTKRGVRYTLRFGEVLIGDGLEVSAGTDPSRDPAETDAPLTSGTENRYLFVTADFDETLLGASPVAPEGYQPTADDDTEATEEPTATTQPTSTPADDESQAQAKVAAEKYEKELAEWGKKVEQGRKLAEELNERFAPWYYVISAADFQNIRPDRENLVKGDSDAGNG